MTAASPNKQKVLALLKSIETGDPAPLAFINPHKYIQHNLAAADGLAGLAALLARLPPNAARVNTVRIFEDGDCVFAHTAYDFFGPKIGFDIFRFEDGRIVEHWDNLQETPAAPNPSGHTMIDGPTEAADLEQTARNKELVRRFMEEVVVQGNSDRRAEYVAAERYTQHAPLIGDGIAGLAAALAELAARGITVQYERIHRVLGEGNFVLVVSEGVLGGEHTSFYDLFRVEDGLIVEHWDTVEAIPPRAAWQNNNGKF